MPMTAAEFGEAVGEAIAPGDAALKAELAALWSGETLTTDGLSLRVSQLLATYQGRMLFGPVASVNSLPIDLGLLGSHLVDITDVTTIDGFGSNGNLENPVYFVTASSAHTLVASANLLTPSGADLYVGAGYSYAVRYVGGSVWRVLWYAGAPGPAGPPGDRQFIPAFVAGPARNNETIFRLEITRSLQLVAAVCKASSAQAPATGQVWTLKRNGVSIATVTFAAGSTTGVISISAPTITAPCVLTLSAPAVVDMAQQDTSITFAGNVA